MRTINPKEISVPQLHGYLQSAVSPRPIAFASTIDKSGNVNLSPFSFFNVYHQAHAAEYFRSARGGD